ncbi:MAG: histidine phosphatase family protein [Patescibacteria group bacterium]|nr:MAG: histidine phosphatase family protein [Patescibacteria group bacterium]
MRIYLARHAQEDIKTGKITELGRRQSRALAQFLSRKDIQALYSSDLIRALETAKIVGKKLDLATEVSPLLREISTSSPGDWTKYIKERHPDLDFLVGGKESLHMVMKRGKQVLEEIIHRNEGKNTAVIAHGIFIKALLYALGYQEYLMKNAHVANTGVTIFKYKSDEVRLVEFNHYGHLFPLRVRESLEKVFRPSG